MCQTVSALETGQQWTLYCVLLYQFTFAEDIKHYIIVFWHLTTVVSMPVSQFSVILTTVVSMTDSLG